MANAYSIDLPTETKIIAALAGFTLCVVSIVYTVNLTTDLASTFEEQLLMGAIGTALELCKFIFIPLGISLISVGLWARGLPILIIGTILLVVSVVASLGFLSSRTNEISESARVQSDEYIIANYDMEVINKQIETLESAAAVDAKSKYGYVRARAREAQEEIKELRYERSALLDQMNSIDGQSMTSAGALFDGLSELFGPHPEVIKEWAYFILSLLLEFCALAAISIAGMAHTRDNLVLVQKAIRLPQESNDDSLDNEDDCTAPHCTDTPSSAASVPRIEDEARYRNIRKAVRCGSLRPTTRALKNAGCSNDFSLEYLRRMAHEGVIERVGRGYRLKTSTAQ